MFLYLCFQYSNWILSPPTLSLDECGKFTANCGQRTPATNVLSPTLVIDEKKLSSHLKITKQGVKVIRIEIYDVEQFRSTEESMCRCNAELCAQHVVANVYSDDVYTRIKDILKSIDNSLFTIL